MTDAPDPIALRAQRVADIAAAHAEAVDRDARFPAEAIAAARDEGLLGAFVSPQFGGEGAALADMVDACYVLGRACGSTAMIFAMHQVKSACVVRHGHTSFWHRDFMARMVRDQLLLASSTTEGRGGGDVRSSAAALVPDGKAIILERAATVMSYGAQADAVVTTARRAPEAAPSDQVLVVFEKADYSLVPTLEWRTLGMRGTCSAGFAMKARGEALQVLPEPYAGIHAETMTPNAHLMWGGVWAGIAAGAVERARLYLRKAARGSEQLPSGVAHLNRAIAHLAALRAMIQGTLARYEAALDRPDVLAGLDFQTAITVLKVDVSENALASVMASMRACGLSGYREDGDASIGRSLRDILAAPVMINNDRILGNLGASPLMVETPRTLSR